MLQAIAGHLDVPGGKVIRMPDRPKLHRNVTAAPIGIRPPIGAAEFPIYDEVRQEAHAGLLPKAILEGDPYLVRGMIVSGASILTAWLQRHAVFAQFRTGWVRIGHRRSPQVRARVPKSARSAGTSRSPLTDSNR